jgi:type VI protein secretion system component VasF
MRPSTLPPSQERHSITSPARRRRRLHRWRLLLVPIAILAVLYAGVGWYLSDQILPGLRVDPPAMR